MGLARMKNYGWEPGNENGQAPTWERVNTAVLLDIRDELQTLNRLLNCPNTVAIPRLLSEIKRNTAKPRKKAVAR